MSARQLNSCLCGPPILLKLNRPMPCLCYISRWSYRLHIDTLTLLNYLIIRSLLWPLDHTYILTTYLSTACISVNMDLECNFKFFSTLIKGRLATTNITFCWRPKTSGRSPKNHKEKFFQQSNNRSLTVAPSGVGKGSPGGLFATRRTPFPCSFSQLLGKTPFPDDFKPVGMNYGFTGDFTPKPPEKPYVLLRFWWKQLK